MKDIQESSGTTGLPAFLPKMLEKQYGMAYTEKIIEGYKVRRKVTLRVNTLKATVEEIGAELEAAGISYSRVPWYTEAFVIEDGDEKRIQELAMYGDGRIYLQSLSSMLPPLALEPRAGADILDMAAAPGGKTTQLAALTGNKAHITACEMNGIRLERLRYNVEKQGASCVYIMQKDSRTLDDFFSFDQILLDAPCSGSGVLDVGDQRLQTRFTEKLIEKSVKAQTALLRKAINLLKKGQEMVYSTCSILACENETIVKSALSGGKVELVPIPEESFPGLSILPVKLEGTLCVAPDELYEGFFLAKLRKK
ncbi:MAG: RsmB/NOP family class I SAM-dependent RNA methyltransferase [Acetatifactor sp.]